MTATVTTTYARTPIADILSVESIRGLSDADLKRQYGMIWAPGQLWERVAEHQNVLTDYTPTRARIKRERLDRAWRTARYNPMLTTDLVRGPSLGAFRERALAGIIRAGERIK